jgi:hypothetical protein
MTEENSRNGAIYVRFGTNDNHVMPLEWAESMLTELKRINGPLFGRLMTRAIDIQPKTR